MTPIREGFGLRSRRTRRPRPGGTAETGKRPGFDGRNRDGDREQSCQTTQERRMRSGGRHNGPVAARPCLNRAGAKPLNIVGECGGGSISTGRVVRQRLQHDCVQVAAQCAANLRDTLATQTAGVLAYHFARRRCRDRAEFPIHQRVSRSKADGSPPLQETSRFVISPGPGCAE